MICVVARVNRRSEMSALEACFHSIHSGIEQAVKRYIIVQSRTRRFVLTRSQKCCQLQYCDHKGWDLFAFYRIFEFYRPIGPSLRRENLCIHRTTIFRRGCATVGNPRVFQQQSGREG